MKEIDININKQGYYQKELDNLLLQDQIKAERLVMWFIVACFLFGAIITYKHNTYLVGFGAGGACLLTYFIGKQFFAYTTLQRYINGTILQLFILQFIFQMHGLYEVHFTYFAITTMFIIYKDVKVLLITGLIPIVQHLVFFALQLGFGYDLREFFINIDNLTYEIMIYHLGIATAHLVVVAVFCVQLKKNLIEYYSNKIKVVESDIIKKKNIELLAKQEELNNTILKLHKAQDIIEEKKAELEVQNESKNKFFGIIAHDLRGPISNICGLNELLLKNHDDFKAEEIHEMLELINDAGKNTFGLLENLLEWSKSESNQRKIIFSDINLDSEITETSSLMSPMFKQKQVTLNIKIKDEVKIVSDKNVIKTILRNLISNSLKFTPSNKNVEVVLYKQENFGVIEVNDEGVGMNTKLIDSLFKIDSVQSSLGTNNERGNGLGLVVCSQLLKEIKGTIQVSSQVGKGSSFKVLLPL
ncbi:HAMP domain-containing histidine kinase [Flavobacteriaceae bacterium]|nr:HAMP domain-containing histidine kinase [Flavobacteriaceae bacterium]